MKLKHKHIRNFELCIPELSDISKELYNNIENSLILKEVPANTLLLKAGESCTHLVCVTDGAIKVTSKSKNGREIPLYEITRNNLCVLNTLCLLCDSYYPAHAVTTSDSRFLLLEASIFKKLINESEIFKKFIYDQIHDQFIYTIAKFEQAYAPNICEQLAGLLVHKSENGTKPIVITQKELSNEIGTAREVISRNMSFFKKNGWIQYSRGIVYISNINVLTELASN